MRVHNHCTALFELSITLRLEDVSADVTDSLRAPLLMNERDLVEDDGARCREWRHAEQAGWPGRYATVFVRHWAERRALLARLNATFDSAALSSSCAVLASLLDDARGRLMEHELWLNGDGVYASGPTLTRAQLRALVAEDAVVTLDASFDAPWSACVMSFAIETRAPRTFVFARARA